MIERLARANELIRLAVTFDTSRRPAQTGPLPDPLGPPTSLVLRSTPTEKPSANGPLVFALAEGFAYGLDGASGAPLWQVPVGQASPYPPRAVPGGSAVLAFDARSDELVRLDARTGAVAWRQEVGEPVADPPLVLGDQVIQATPSGTVLADRPADGRGPGDLQRSGCRCRGPRSATRRGSTSTSWPSRTACSS